jgi:hypothetical protein
MTEHRGSCHCGRVRFVVRREIDRVSECNCSICVKKGILHWIVEKDEFTLESGSDWLSTYTFNTGVAKHHFCKVCGIAAFYIPRSDPDRIDVNIRCVEGVDLSLYPTTRFDGQNWEASIDEFHSGN